MEDAGRSQDGLRFHTGFVYTDRETKAKFVWLKYGSILKGQVLDVGADQCFLKRHLPEDVEYVGIGLGDSPGLVKVDVEKEAIPYPDNSFDCVLCLDVLEHVDNIHEVFDELCRVTRNWVIVSLPNPWQSFMTCLQKGKYSPDRNLKFYGLPLEKPADRHKWFFSSSEARDFVAYRAEKNRMDLYDFYLEGGEGRDGLLRASGWSGRWLLRRIQQARRLLFRHDLRFADLYEGHSWYVLRKRSGRSRERDER